MSKYQRVQTKFKNSEILAQAIADVCQKNSIMFEAGESVTIYGWKRQTATGEFVIRKGQLRSIGDLGFHRTDDGTFEVIIDDLDRRGARIVKQVKQRYARLEVERMARARGMRVEEVEENGVTRMRLYPQKARTAMRQSVRR